MQVDGQPGIPSGGGAAVDTARGRATRIRLGLALIILSWLPVAQTIIWARNLSGSDGDRLRLVIWSIQIVVGLIGAAVAGREAIALAKQTGYRALPRTVWSLLRSPGGDDPTA